MAVLDPQGGDGPDTLAVRLSRAVLDRASAVVVASPDEADLAAGVAAALHLGIPLLVSGPGLEEELDRLGTRTVVRYSSAGTDLGGREVFAGTAVEDLPQLPGLPRTPSGHGAVALVRDGVTVPPALEPLLAAVGAVTVTVPDADPRASEQARVALRDSAAAPVVALGAGFGSDARLAQRVRTSRKADELPGGGLLPFPDRRMVALYGHPETAAMGMLGEQPPARAVERVRRLAGEYAALADLPVVPAFELIATVASGSRQRDGSYSRRTPVDVLMPYVEAAERAGMYVVLDLQPGRTDFLAQARHYEELLRRPWVGLALDPEWRLRPGQVHLEQIGSVGIAEVNRVGAWLAALVRKHDLPPKVLTLHQFRQSMVRDRPRLDTTLDEVQWLVHADGLGTQGDKQATWTALRAGLPEGVWLGWKNFEDEDSPMLTPAQTMATVHPAPWFVSYQ